MDLETGNGKKLASFHARTNGTTDLFQTPCHGSRAGSLDTNMLRLRPKLLR